MLVNFLAEVWGISIVIVSFALLLNEKYLKTLFAEVENNATMLFWGVVTLVIGLAMVLSYNVWDKSWQVIITIFGWLSLIKGAAILFVPESIKKWTRKIESSSYLPYALVVAIIIGLVLTYFGFTA